MVPELPIKTPRTQAALLEIAARSLKQAERFQAAVRQSLSLIEEAAKHWPPCRHGMCRYVLIGFPYLVIYRESELGIFVATVSHGSRKPDWWVDRLREEQPTG